MFVGILALGQALSALPEPRLPARTDASIVASAVKEDELLLYSVQLDQLTLTDGLSAYGNPEDPFLPIGELARLLDLDIDVSPSDYRITGSIGDARKAIIVDLRSGIARIGGRSIPLLPSDVAYSRTDIYVRSAVIGRLLPIRPEVAGDALAIRLHATDKLPVQARLERIARIRGLTDAIDAGVERPVRIRSPYQLVSPPAFDVTIEGGRDTRTLQPYSARYDVRFAGDLLYANLQGYIGADDSGRPQTARLLVERRSVDGALPLRATRISGGDVFTPALPLGVRSIGGRGFSFTSAPLEEASVFDTIDLRGELPIGFDVELYVNDILRSGERTPVRGRYEFLNVPLVRGVNVIRIVSYGPRGERNETVRVVNVGGGQLRKGEVQFEAGAVEQGRALVELRPSIDDEIVDFTASGPRVVGTAAYGLTEGLTVVGGTAYYRTLAKDHRGLATLGLRTSVFGWAARADVAMDTTGGTALALGFAGQPLGVSTVFEHAEYRSDFFDETISALDPDRPRTRHSALTVDLGLPPIAGRRIPVSFRGIRDEFTDGGIGWVASARTSATVLNTLLSAGLDYQRTTTASGDSDERLLGSIAASRLLNFTWQLRSSLDFDVRPERRLRAVSATADRNVSDHLALRIGLGRTLADDKDTFGQLGAVYRLPFGELTASADYSLARNDWRLAVRFGFGSVFNPMNRRYVMTPPGAASGGSAALRAFIDRDADGRLGPGDEPAPRVLVQGGRDEVITSEAGTALITGLGINPSATLSINTKDIDQLYVRDAPARVQFEPRPGVVVEIPYAIQPAGEVYARFVMSDASSGPVGLSALRVVLVGPEREPVSGLTEYDGSVVFSEIPPGTYSLELDRSQAEKLGMKLLKPVMLEVQAEGVVEVEAVVEFIR